MVLQDKYVISEFYSFTPDRSIILEAEKNNNPIVLKGILQKANTQNRNGRVYPFEILKREADKYMEAVKERRASGELDHPESAVVSLANVSHIVTEMWWEGETLMGKVEVLDTPAGNILKGLLRSGVMLGISSRGIGSVKRENEKDVVQDDFELIAFDFVSSPSTPGAYLFKEAREWGLTKISNNGATKIMKPEEFCNIHEQKENKLNNILKNDFWSKI